MVELSVLHFNVKRSLWGIFLAFFFFLNKTSTYGLKKKNGTKVHQSQISTQWQRDSAQGRDKLWKQRAPKLSLRELTISGTEYEEVQANRYSWKQWNKESDSDSSSNPHEKLKNVGKFN